MGRSVCLSVGLSVCRSVCLSVCQSACLPFCRPACLSVGQSVGRCVCLPVCLSVRQSVWGLSLNPILLSISRSSYRQTNLRSRYNERRWVHHSDFKQTTLTFTMASSTNSWSVVMLGVIFMYISIALLYSPFFSQSFPWLSNDSAPLIKQHNVSVTH